MDQIKDIIHQNYLKLKQKLGFISKEEHDEKKKEEEEKGKVTYL